MARAVNRTPGLSSQVNEVTYRREILTLPFRS
jgi:hypothetical protein